ncbi:flavodoxin family protein [Streptococcus sp. zg-JUN1979]|uniref:flavodoxin family protein n=1 Tax=Streptococcus sp. zg-JUN1979 TaxID=3391450 RepID=UPI0039A60F59
MKKAMIASFLALAVLLVGWLIAFQLPSVINQDVEANDVVKGKVVFVNASQHKSGNTVKMAEGLLDGIDYEQIDLVDYPIGFLGQELADDAFADFLEDIKQAEVLVIGTPIYWHSMSASLKAVLDRSADLDETTNTFAGKKLYFFLQGASPTELAKENTLYMMERFAAQLGMTLEGSATSQDEIASLSNQLKTAISR